MRTPQQIEQIVSSFSPPYSVEDFLTQIEIDHLVAMFEDSRNHIHKNTGPITLNLHSDSWQDPVLANVISKLHAILGDFDILAAFFFYVEMPHIIHNDDSFSLPVTYKGVTLPLKITYTNENVGLPSLCFFDQYYLNGPSKFYNGETKMAMYHNIPVFNYDSVIGTTNEPFPENTRVSHFSHIKAKWLEGLSLDVMLPWKPGNALIFDSIRLHCASNFVSQGIQSKLGISIFTQKS